MAVHKSVIKSHRQSLKRRARNQEIKSRVKTLIKKVRQSIDKKDHVTALTQLRDVNKVLDGAVNKGVLKHNTASRRMSRLARAVHLVSRAS
ncbi:MAG: 30S ribosomal protein S20 [Deltaproteobacteria bacterium]|nr:30S ribosomal protein S20 [Deltaproteobacteria bacterium]